MGDHDAMMARFVHDYLELLDHRVSSIRNHLEQRNFMTAHVALLSLESTSVMVGAQALARAAGRLREAVEQGERDTVTVLLADVSDEADRTRRELGQHPVTGPAGDGGGRADDGRGAARERSA